MTEQPGLSNRRRRRRATAAAGAPPPSESPKSSAQAPRLGAATPATSATPPTPQPPATRRQRPQRDAGERGLGDLVGAGPSQLGVSGALRGRDVNRPSDADLAEAEKTTVIVRRNWKPTGKL